MKKIKSIIAVVLCICTVLCCSVFSASALNEKLVYTYTGSYATLTDCSGGASANVIIPTSVTYGGKNYSVKFIGEQAFSGCKYIQRIAIPKGATAVKSRAFENCTGLTDVYVPRSIVSFAYDAFEGCENVTVHCYKSNYQFFSVLGYAPNITIDVVDDTVVEEKPGQDQEQAAPGGIEDLITGIIGGDSGTDVEDFIQIDTSQEGLIQMITRFINLFMYIVRNYLMK